MSSSYEDLLSRNETAGSSVGFAEPRWKSKVCGWCHGKDCPRCEASRIEYRSAMSSAGLAVGPQYGRLYYLESDPYSKDVHVGVKLNESEATKKAQRAAVITDTLRVLERNVRLRAGVEALPDKAMSNYLRVAKKPRGYNRVAKGLWLLQTTRPTLHELLPSSLALRATVILMHHCTKGRFPDPPKEGL